MNSSVNLGGLVGLLNDYPEDMHKLLVEIRDHDEKQDSKQADPPPPLADNPKAYHLE